jgi:Mitochondrial carrier protein
MFYEELKALGYSKSLSGVASGMLATAITHPFEIVRAKLQTIGLY